MAETHFKSNDKLETIVECETCSGSGEVDDRRCITCRGTGVRKCID